MTDKKDKEHDIDYADPEEEQKEKKVSLQVNDWRLNYLKLRKWQEKSQKNAFLRWEPSCIDLEMINGKRGVLGISSSWDTRKTKRLEDWWDKKRPSNLLLIS